MVGKEHAIIDLYISFMGFCLLVMLDYVVLVHTVFAYSNFDIDGIVYWER